MKKLLIASGILFLSNILLAAPAPKEVKYNAEFKYFVDTNMPGVNFEGEAKSFEMVKATLVTTDAGVKLQDIEMEVSSDKLTSGIEMRDKHTQEKIFAPINHGAAPCKIVLKIKEANCSGEKDNYTCQGEGPLKIGDKEITQKFTFNLGKDGEVKTEFDLSLTAFGIKAPTYMGVEVNDQVKIKFDAKTTNL